MIEIRYAAQSGVEISGTLADLRNLKQRIDVFLDTDTYRLTVDVSPDSDPCPYDVTIAKFVIEKASGPTKISLQEGTIIYARGSVSHLEAFASFFVFDTESESGEHRHFEYYEGNEQIDKDSEPVVIGVSLAKDDV